MPASSPDTLMRIASSVLEPGPLKSGDLDYNIKKEHRKVSPGMYIYNTHLSYVKNRLLKTGVIRKFRHGAFVFYYLTEQVPDHLRGGVLHDPIERMIFCDWLADNRPELEAAWRKTVGARGTKRTKSKR